MTSPTDKILTVDEVTGNENMPSLSGSVAADVSGALQLDLTMNIESAGLPAEGFTQLLNRSDLADTGDHHNDGEEDDLIDIDGQDGLDPALKAADELKAAIIAGEADVDILGGDHDNNISSIAMDKIQGMDMAMDEEEEDIDIVEVDEEEEAKVKQAMGVGEGMPVVEMDYEGHVGYGAPHEDGTNISGRPLTDAEEDIVMHEGPLKGKRANRQKRKIMSQRDEIEIDGDGNGPQHDGFRSSNPLIYLEDGRQRHSPTKKKRSSKGSQDGDEEYEEYEEDGDEDDINNMDGTGDNSGINPDGTPRGRRGKGGKSQGRRSEESLLKFSIKSFTVPELVVALPEYSTVGQLKKAVMESAMRLLGGSLRVRVMLHGKRLQDEAQSLPQAGITRSSVFSGKASDALSFMLEPSVPFASNSDPDPLLVLSQGAAMAGGVDPNPPSQSARSMYGMHAVPPVGQGGSNHGNQTRSRGKSDEDDDDDKEYDINDDLYTDSRRARQKISRNSAPSAHTTRMAAAQALAAIRAQNEESLLGGGVKMEGGPNGSIVGPSAMAMGGMSNALVLHPSAMDGGMYSPMQSHSHMAMMPHQGSSMGMMPMMGEGSRRTRRPFTVGEVVALVEAVEKLGTGRWREVKLRAFAAVKHRTYVDLKDKWKTLVHTAQIAPHQRRGEPVPQDLLERVTNAHAFWTAQLRNSQQE